MIICKVTDTSIFKSSQPVKGIFIPESGEFPPEIKELESTYFPALSSLLSEQKFTGKAGSHLIIPISVDGTINFIVLLGLGKKDASGYIGIESYRRALGSFIKIIQNKKYDSGALLFPDAAFFNVSVSDLAKETAIISRMATYRFETYITDDDRKVSQEITLSMCASTHNKKQIEEGIEAGLIIGQAVNQARFWVDLPPNALTPPELAEKARIIADEYALKITTFGEEEIKKLGMGGLAAVSAGSDQDCRFVILEYHVSETAPTICLVGKGITFDSGGLSLKPSAYMETMKEDMAGAAAVISAMQALACLKPKVNVIGITPLSENLPSGKATKPGDIICFYNGKTAEVKNTDAEGRLILADGLAYAVEHFKPDAIIDIATLTGACAYALGPFFSGLMTQHEEIGNRLKKAGERTGDRVWELPLHNDYRPAIKSAVADMANVGNKQYMAGTITAAFFLKNFVGETPWAHIDIAGTAFNVPAISYYNVEGATGAGVRLLIELIMQWQ